MKACTLIAAWIWMLFAWSILQLMLLFIIRAAAASSSATELKAALARPAFRPCTAQLRIHFAVRMRARHSCSVALFSVPENRAV